MNNKKNKRKNTAKSVSSKKFKITAIILSVVVVAIITSVIIFFLDFRSDDIKDLCKNSWIPYSAKNSSGDEVEIAEVYNNYYTSYQGSMIFSDDGKFSLWLTPGEPDDGTHSGTYSLKNESAITASFDDGTTTTFELKRKNNRISVIVVGYEDYKVSFVQQ